MSAGDTESINSVNISNREKRTSRVLDAIHMFEQKTSPTGSPTASNQVKLFESDITTVSTGVIQT